MPVPWITIITSLPGLIDAASKLFRKAGSSPKIDPSSDRDEQLAAIIKRLEYYESLEVDQAKLLQQTIEQLQNVSVSCSAAARRINLAIAISLIALLLSAGAFFTR